MRGDNFRLTHVDSKTGPLAANSLATRRPELHAKVFSLHQTLAQDEPLLDIASMSSAISIAASARSMASSSIT